MQYKVTNPERKEIILNNIRLLRKLKEIKSETVAKEIGISKGEYSKLENGLKQNWEKYWLKIGEVLGINHFELAFEDCLIQTQNGNLKSNNILKKARDNDEINEKIYKTLEERDRLKDELIETYKQSTGYWKDKYYRLKAKFIKTEQRMETLIKKTFHLNGKSPFGSGSGIGPIAADNYFTSPSHSKSSK